jgi:hypothetical protein
MSQVTIYKLDEADFAIFNNINSQQRENYLIVCSYGEHLGVVNEDLQKPEFSDYLNAISFDANNVIEVEIVSPFNFETPQE